MNYTPPKPERAMDLYEEIRNFLISCGGHYQERWGNADEDTHIILSLVTGQFIYKQGCYFICWFMVTDGGIEDLKEHIRPDDVINGENMWVLECGLKEGWPELRRKLRKRGKQGIHWHRAGKGLKDFPRQKGADYGR